MESCTAPWSRCRGEINEASAQGAGPLTCALIYHNSSAPPRLTQPRDWGGFRSDVDKAQKVHFSLTKSSQFSLVGGCRQVTGPAKGWLGVSGLRKGPGDPGRTWAGKQRHSRVRWGRAKLCALQSRSLGCPNTSPRRSCTNGIIHRGGGGGGVEPPYCHCRVKTMGNSSSAGPPPGQQERQPISRVPCPQNAQDPSGADCCSVPRRLTPAPARASWPAMRTDRWPCGMSPSGRCAAESPAIQSPSWALTLTPRRPGASRAPRRRRWLSGAWMSSRPCRSVRQTRGVIYPALH